MSRIGLTEFSYVVKAVHLLTQELQSILGHNTRQPYIGVQYLHEYQSPVISTTRRYYSQTSIIRSARDRRNPFE